MSTDTRKKYVCDLHIKDEHVKDQSSFAFIQIAMAEAWHKDVQDQGYVQIGDLEIQLLEALKFEGEYLDPDGPHFMLRVEGEVIDALEAECL